MPRFVAHATYTAFACTSRARECTPGAQFARRGRDPGTKLARHTILALAGVGSYVAKRHVFASTARFGIIARCTLRSIVELASRTHLASSTIGVTILSCVARRALEGHARQGRRATRARHARRGGAPVVVLASGGAWRAPVVAAEGNHIGSHIGSRLVRAHTETHLC